MRIPSLVFGSLIIGCACGPEVAGQVFCVEASGRLLATNPGELTARSAGTITGDTLLVSLGDTPHTVVAVDLCGDRSRERLAGPEQGLGNAFVITGPEGALALGRSTDTNTLVLLDRLEVPGVDAPRPLITLPDHTDVSALLGDALLLCRGDGCLSSSEL